MIGKVVLAGGAKCPICGKEFKPEPPLRPNMEDREFYGGRVKFFKEVDCDCTAKYDLCIEKRFDSIKEDDTLSVINMIVLKEGVPLEELKRQEMERLSDEAEAKAMEAVHEAIEAKGDVPTLQQRQEIKRQTILATVIDKDQKVDTLMMYTQHELQIMCKRRKIKTKVREPKKSLVEKLLANDPTMVVAGPEG